MNLTATTANPNHGLPPPVIAAHHLMEKGEFSEAIRTLTPVVQAMDLDAPDSGQVFALLLMADAQRFSDQPAAAYKNYVIASELDPAQSDRLLPHMLHCISAMKQPLDSATFERHVMIYLERVHFDNGAIDRLCREALIKKFELDNEDAELDFPELIHDPFLLATTRHLILADPLVEKFLSQLRQVVFSLAVDNNLIEDLQDIVIALADHAELVEYAFPISEAEQVVLLGLRTLLDGEIKSAHDLETHVGPMMLYAMFEPVSTLAGAQFGAKLDIDELPEAVRPLLTRLFLHPARENELAGTIPGLRSIRNETSLAVQQQYEQNPYPRWRDLFITESKVLYLDLYPDVKHHVTQPNKFQSAQRCLVAGAGTGKQPLWLAANCLNSNITALDLSRSSLAYAKRRAQELDLTVDFYQGDLLDLTELDTEFDIIECSGVLHHMEEPEAGLAALLEHLRAGGLLRLGLYSRIARTKTGVNFARIDPRQLDTNIRETVRQTRATHLNNLSSIASQSRDFYTTSECRDLLFHVQEHQFDLLELSEILQRHNLRFLGFNRIPAPLKEQYLSQFPRRS